MAFYQQIQGLAQLLLPAKTPDTNIVNGRMSGYGESAVNPYLNKKHAVAGEGSYFSTASVPGSGATHPIVTSYANTAGTFFFQNLNPAGGPTAYLDFFKLVVTQVPASTTQFRYAIIKDLASNLAITTNHVTAASPVNVNGGATLKSNCLFLYTNSATATVNAAPSGLGSVISVGNIGGLPIIGDELVIDFGGDPSVSYGATAVASRKVSVAPELAVAPGWQVMFVMWVPGNAATGGTYDFEFTHIER
jgi:hypothetical protein